MKKRNPEGVIPDRDVIIVLKFYVAVREKRANLDLSYLVPHGTDYKELTPRVGAWKGELSTPGNIPAEAVRWARQKLLH